MTTQTPLPASVQRQLEQADAIQAQIAASAEPPPMEAIQPAAPIAPVAPAPAPAAPASVTDDATWQQRFRTINGLAAAADRRAQEAEQAKAELAQRLNALTARLGELENARAESPKQEMNPRDVEQFGSDMMEMLQRHITTALGAFEDRQKAAFGSLAQRLVALEQTVTGVSTRTAETAERTFWSMLTDAVPDWEAVNGSEDFHLWLAEVDRMTGAPRQALLQAAQKAQSVERVAAIFNAFKEARPKPPAQALASQVSPGTGGSAAPPQANPATQVVSQKFIRDFYNDVARGRYKGRELEMNQTEAAINQALAENRVR